MKKQIRIDLPETAHIPDAIAQDQDRLRYILAGTLFQQGIVSELEAQSITGDPLQVFQEKMNRYGSLRRTTSTLFSQLKRKIKVAIQQNAIQLAPILLISFLVLTYPGALLYKLRIVIDCGLHLRSFEGSVCEMHSEFRILRDFLFLIWSALSLTLALCFTINREKRRGSLLYSTYLIGSLFFLFWVYIRVLGV